MRGQQSIFRQLQAIEPTVNLTVHNKNNAPGDGVNQSLAEAGCGRLATSASLEVQKNRSSSEQTVGFRGGLSPRRAKQLEKTQNID
jgi:hypothetical protein